MAPDAAVRDIGRRLHEALPAPSRNPIKVADARAMLEVD